jgi:parvulin-like peptidyl-prolyl isomerase
MFKKIRHTLIIIFIVSIFLIGCLPKWEAQGTTSVTNTPEIVEIQVTPSPTSLPLAIRVNEGGILMSDYLEEYKRLDSASVELGKNYTPEEIKNRLVQDLIGQEILYQAAQKSGFSFSDQEYETYLNSLVDKAGGIDAFNSWKNTNFYTENSFRRFIIRSLGASYQRDQIIQSLPNTVEQVHARQIFFSREESANNYKQQISAGGDFLKLASQAEPIADGDLGWFPRGYLLQPEVEEAAFRLAPGEVSEVIKSNIGYHLIQVIEKDPSRTLDPDTKPGYQRAAIQNWIEQEKLNNQIEILIP